MSTSNSAAVSNSTSPSLPICTDCERRPAVVYCYPCKTPLCARCDKEVVHIAKSTRYHDRMKIEEHLMVERSLGHSSPTDEQVDADDNNTFIFVNPIDHHIHLQPRLASLVPDSDARPSLVSFIGPTGVGKSTLLRMLISLEGTRDAGHMPLAGGPNDAQSTSADIHIYAGGQAQNLSGAQSGGDSTYPLLYLDSEGFSGSVEPRAIMKFSKLIKERAYEAFKNNRRNHVHASYPRMLYIFSDVLCFVFSGDWRERDSIVEPLIKWGTSAAFGAANQHRPQLILIFNKTGPDAADVEFNDFQKTYEKWIRGDNSGSQKQLLQYYSKPLVVRLPHLNLNPQVVLERVKKLRLAIHQSTLRIRISREEAHQLFTRRQLQIYMQLAADTFSKDPGAEFDIYKAIMAGRPPPTGLAGYIAEFFRAVQRANSQHHDSNIKRHQISFNILEMRIECSIRLWIARLNVNLPVGASAHLPEDLRIALEQAQREIDGGLPCAAISSVVISTILATQ